MKLKELIEGIARELKSAGLEEAGASLSLVFSARKETDGLVSCDFVETSAISRPKAEDLHRIEFKLEPGARKSCFETKGKTAPVRIRLLGEEASEIGVEAPDRDLLDKPAIFRLNGSGSTLGLRR